MWCCSGEQRVVIRILDFDASKMQQLTLMHIYYFSTAVKNAKRQIGMIERIHTNVFAKYIATIQTQRTGRERKGSSFLSLLD